MGSCDNVQYKSNYFKQRPLYVYKNLYTTKQKTTLKLYKKFKVHIWKSCYLVGIHQNLKNIRESVQGQPIILYYIYHIIINNNVYLTIKSFKKSLNM